MTNVIRHPKFLLQEDDDTLDRLKSVLNGIGMIDKCLHLASPLLSAAAQTELHATCRHAQTEIREMISKGTFTRERLNTLAIELREIRLSLCRSDWL